MGEPERAVSTLVTLLHLCDSLFPIGGFAHSDGLEAAAGAGRVRCADDLQAWMDVYLDEMLAGVEGPAVLMAWQAAVDRHWSRLTALDDELQALRPSSTARAASRAMGARLIRTWAEVYPAAAPVPGPDRTLPVAFGGVCAASGIAGPAAVGGYMYTRLAAIASAAMRLMPVGQRDAHSRLSAALARVPAAVALVERRAARGDRLGAFTPGLDLAAMEQPHLPSRLFLS